jgi:long-chain fatty acid transport protein
MRRPFELKLIVLGIGLLASGATWATNGYFSHGYGMKAKGMGGASTAIAADTFGGASNPAKMVWVGKRVDVGVDVFNPDREASRKGSGFGGIFGENFDGSQDGNDDNPFIIPEFGFNWLINPDLSAGVSVYGNGGMNTRYEQQPGKYTCLHPVFGPVPAENLLCGNNDLGVDLAQLVIAPTVAYKFHPNHSVGVSPLIAYQRFKAYGLQAFGAISSDPSNLTNEGYDYSWGYGVRVGWMGKLSPTITVGAAYSSKIYMDELDTYKGLFAEEGDFDIPENYNVGIAFQATPKILIALDYQRINYGDVDSVANSSRNPCCLGDNNGPGFGWDDVNVWKLGVEYMLNNQWTLRAGYNHGDNPIDGDDVTFNILAPATIQDHVTAGFTYTTAGGGELTVAGMYAFENDVDGEPNPVHFPVGGKEKIEMSQWSIGIAYGWKM